MGTVTAREKPGILCYGLRCCLLHSVLLKPCGEWLKPLRGVHLSSSLGMAGTRVLARDVSWDEKLVQQGGKALIWPGIKDFLNDGCPCLNSGGIGRAGQENSCFFGGGDKFGRVETQKGHREIPGLDTGSPHHPQSCTQFPPLSIRCPL